MAQSSEVTIAGKRYANAAAYIQAIVGSMRSIVHKRGTEPVAVTLRPDEKLDADEVKALQ